MDNEAPEQLADKQSAKISKRGGKRANSGGRRPSAGRKKGVPNKLTADLKAAILAAFDEVGGAAYLRSVATTDPRTFCMLLGKVLPNQVAGDSDQPVRVQFSWLAPAQDRSRRHCQGRRSLRSS
jgi:hypothetical protein